ncbi:MAG: thioredoxin domain-containing protein [Haloarculaceae archaeon]
MSDPTDRNRLSEAESPYLRQHADNPVNWQPWDEAALTAARERDVPIFLSIGYSSCHWCHVMAEESFEDEDVAALLNERFVPIKVDREERPDLDAVYMSICQQVTGRGGWPLSVWLTPGGDPFYVGTYFPREPRRGTPGFEQLLADIAESWADPEERADMEERARQWTEAIESDLSEVPDQPGDPPEESLLGMAADAAVRGADRQHGGWGPGPKFPHPGRLAILGRALARERRSGEGAGDTGESRAETGTDADEYRAVIAETLDAMGEGGLYDHVGGGFHRYCTDREWVVPHFEKMLYDNGTLPAAFLAGHQVAGRERYARVVRETVAFLDRELAHEDGGFYSALDARSEGESGEVEEGAFYIWTPEKVREAVDDETAADLFCDRFGVTDAGNFEGATVLTVSAGVDELAAEYDLAPDEVRERLANARERIFAARAERSRPALDDKVLAGWNGLVVSALAEAGIVLDAEYADRGARALAFVREHLWDDSENRLARRYRDGDVQVTGYLEDYAFLGRGALDLFGATGDVSHLVFALDLARAIEREFWDADDGTLYFTPRDGESLIARPQELTDQSTPSSAGVAAQLLFSLSHFVTHDRFERIGEGVIATHADRIEADPLQHASLVLAADQYRRGALELTLVADEPPAEWRETLAEQFLPDSLLAWRPADDDALSAWLDELGLESVPPIWAERGPRDGEPTVYACRNFACSPPAHDLGEAIEWTREN